MANDLNYQPPAKGFSSYLANIIPEDQAIAAGAFGRAMLQIRNIENVDATPFAKVVYSMEGTNELADVNGTDKPTDDALATAALEKQGLGGGIYGTYTVSNYYGAMSGLPYPLKKIYESIIDLQTRKLSNIYSELYLAMTWEPPTVTVQYTTSPGPTYTVTGITITNKGGGYGRGSAPQPIITISNGGSASGVFGTDKDDVGSVGAGTYGRLIDVTNFVAGPSSGTIPTVTIQYPPTATLPVQTNGYVATGGTNTSYGTSGWPTTMDAVVQSYIDQANTEINAIKNLDAQNISRSKLLNTYYDLTGIALKQEQRARYITVEPVPVPYDNRYSPVPTAFNTFVDAIPNFSGNTEPHMAAQTLENITDRNTVGGQSVVAMMRQERNQERLAQVGIELDNNISDKLDIDLQKQLLLNGTVCGAIEGITSPDGCVYTIPANAECPKPYNYYDNGLRVITSYTPGSIQPILDGNPNPIVNPNSPAGPGIIPEPPINPFVINQNVDTFPAPNINSDYITSTLCPATYDPNAAIDKVVECNCDCWVK